MNTEQQFSAEIVKGLELGRPVVLLSIIELEGSSPRHPGSRMYVSQDGIGHGTIGGSLLEFRSVEAGRLAFGAKKSAFLEFDLAPGSKDSIGMICGGKAKVLVDYIPAVSETRSLFRRWNGAVSAGESFLFVTRVKESGSLAGSSSHNLVFKTGEIIGERVYPGPLEAEQGVLTTVTTEDGRLIIDPVKNLKTLFCFGGGHVAMPTVHIAALAGFRAVVIDDRDEFANAVRFPDAVRICVIRDYHKAFDGLEVDEDSFIVIMTRGHAFDRVVLELALGTPAQYIGMISSRAKRNTIYEALREKGFTQADLDRVHSPIGIPIDSETPEEIAVSIVGELIKVRAGGDK
jgi:xanthine dehydrogenase accessory factor